MGFSFRLQGGCAFYQQIIMSRIRGCLVYRSSRDCDHVRDFQI